MHSSTAPTTMGKQETAGEMAARHRQTRGQNVAAWTEPYCRGYRCTAQGLSRGCGSGKVSPFWTRAKHRHWPDHDRLVQFPRIVRKKNLLHTRVQSLAFCECVLRLKVTCSTSHDYLCCNTTTQLEKDVLADLEVVKRTCRKQLPVTIRKLLRNTYRAPPRTGLPGSGLRKKRTKTAPSGLSFSAAGIRPWPGLASPLAPSMICND